MVKHNLKSGVLKCPIFMWKITLNQYKIHMYALTNGLKNKRAYAKQTYRTPAYSRYSPATEVV